MHEKIPKHEQRNIEKENNKIKWHLQSLGLGIESVVPNIKNEKI